MDGKIWLPNSADLSMPGRWGNAMQEGHKYQLFVFCVNGVRLTFVKNQQFAGAEALFLAIAAGKQPGSFEDYDVDGRVGGGVFLNGLAGFEGEAEDTAVFVHEKRLGIRVIVMENPVVV
jgi:hypothetical protein